MSSADFVAKLSRYASIRQETPLKIGVPDQRSVWVGSKSNIALLSIAEQTIPDGCTVSL